MPSSHVTHRATQVVRINRVRDALNKHGSRAAEERAACTDIWGATTVCRSVATGCASGESLWLCKQPIGSSGGTCRASQACCAAHSMRAQRHSACCTHHCRQQPPPKACMVSTIRQANMRNGRQDMHVRLGAGCRLGDSPRARTHAHLHRLPLRTHPSASRQLLWTRRSPRRGLRRRQQNLAGVLTFAVNQFTLS